MATLDLDDANIVEGDTFNWRLVVYPLVVAVVLVLGGVVYYLYLQNQRGELEITARQDLLQAKTPEALVAVADKYPATEQATLALLSAAGDSSTKKDYAAAIRDYQRIIDNPGSDPQLRDSAQMGLGSVLEESGKADEAISAYLAVAKRGNDSAYAPAAYYAAASIYRQRGDKSKEISVLLEEVTLDSQSTFVRAAKERLGQISPAAVPPNPNAPLPTPQFNTPSP
ncbi:MAG TPA: tetratricopeptide repeat protein [Candidatus Methylacidiphilales bacterium]|nr:tetratricopeptide repeat protein [Candidatus Methylacidiphilales bacterium]